MGSINMAPRDRASLTHVQLVAGQRRSHKLTWSPARKRFDQLKACSKAGEEQRVQREAYVDSYARCGLAESLVSYQIGH